MKLPESRLKGLLVVVLLGTIGVVAGVAMRSSDSPATSEADQPAEPSGEVSALVEQASDLPDVILINLDDASWDLLDDAALEHLPNIKRTFRDQGLRLTNLHVTDPLCGPSRASLFRGQYPHNTGVRFNAQGWNHFYDSGYTDDEIGFWMQEAGYSTALVGKYCHEGYPEASQDSGYVPPGWDEFHATAGGRYFSVRRNINGEALVSAEYPNAYLTDIEAASALEILDHSTSPTFLYLAHIAPHAASNSDDPMVPARYADRFNDLQVPRTPNFNEADTSDKSDQFAQVPIGDAADIERWDESYRDRMRAMLAVDDMVGELVRALEDAGRLDKAYLFLTSDNGYLLGQHRLGFKQFHLDPTTRVPLFVRGPGIEPGSADHLLSHIDLIPTILEIGGGDLPHLLDGKSFLPVLTNTANIGSADWQQAVLIEHQQSRTASGVELDLRYEALRRHSDVYIRFENGDREYYDLDADPYQLNNTASSLTDAESASLEAQLDDLVSCQGRSCQAPDGAGYDPISSTMFVDSTSDPNMMLLTGAVTDDEAVAGVEVVIRTVARRQYWNGTAFVDEYTTVDAQLTSAGLPESTWSYRAPINSGHLYWVSARAVDADGNRQVVLETSFVGTGIDEVIPQVFIEEARQDEGGSVTVSGTAIEQDLAAVRVVLRDEASGLYWNGTELQERFVRIPATVALIEGDRWSWQLTIDVPPGRFYVAPWAFDVVGNLSSQPPPSERIDVD